MKFEDYYNQKIKEKWNENINHVKKQIHYKIIPKELYKKIQNEANEKNFTIHELIEGIKNNNIIASFFAKKPLRQNIPENTQLEFIQTKYPSTFKLKQMSSESLIVKNGKICNKKKKKDTFSTETKAIDFYDPIHDIYYFAKYINKEGGFQDNQYNEIISCINQIQIYLEKNKNKRYPKKFTIVVDGPYINKRFQKLKEYENDILHIVNSDDFLK